MPSTIAQVVCRGLASAESRPLAMGAALRTKPLGQLSVSPRPPWTATGRHGPLRSRAGSQYESPKPIMHKTAAGVGYSQHPDSEKAAREAAGAAMRGVD